MNDLTNKLRWKVWNSGRVLSVIVLLLTVSVLGHASTYAQGKKLNIDAKDLSLREVFENIEKQSEFYFMYSDSHIDVDQKVSIKASESTIDQILKKVLKGKDISWEIIDKQIILTKKGTEKNTLKEVPQDNKKIKGLVLNENGEGMPFVNILLKGTDIGAVTDINGNFTIAIKDANSVLIFSYVGYERQIVTIGNRIELTIRMNPIMLNMEEIVVVGYGTTHKKMLTGSVAQIDGEEMRATASSGIEGAIQGKTAGVQITQNSGTPGASVSVKVRGIASLYSGTQPLYVVDGVPITTGNYGQIGFEGQDIDASMDLNPNDIESISVLKDASAAIYGARAANGVILITTKSGKEGKSKISYNSYVGIQREWKRLDLMNANQWKDYVSNFDPDFVNNLTDQSINTDWQDEVFRPAIMTNHELAFSGGNSKTKVFMSGGYFDQEGIIIGSDYKKYSGRANVDHKLNDRLDFSFRTGLNYSINNRIVGDQSINGVLPNAISKPPVYAVRDSLENYLEEGFWDNPVAIGNEVTNQANTLRSISNFDINYKITEGLVFRNKFGADFYNLHERRYEPTTVDRGAESNGIAIDARANVQSLIQQSTLSYHKTLAGVHNLSFLLGYSLEVTKERYNFIRASNFPSDNLQYIISAGNIEEAYSDALDENLNSVFGRIKYNYNDTYLAEFSLRRDGSSKFGANNRHAILPAGSLAWRIGETFLQGNEVINELKLKTGFGIIGNDQIGNNRYQNLYISGENYYSLPGLAPKQIPNPDLKWETTRNFNIGTDIEFFKSRIAFSAEAYYNKTTDLLMPRPIPGSSGFSTYMANVGSIINKGLEFTLHTVNIDGAFTWESNLNISLNRNEILDLYNDQPITGQGRGENAALVGYPVGVFYIYESLGVDPSTGDLVLEDLNGDGEITELDRQVIGDPNPDFTGGFVNTMRYKGFDLRIFFQFSYGNEIFNGTRQYAESLKYGINDNQLVTVLDRWQQPGDITYIPRDNGTYNLFPSSHYIEDGSYLRLKDITVGYNVPSEKLKNSKLFSKFRVYVKGQNLLTFTNYSGLDPEVNYSGIGTMVQGTDFFTFPQARAFLIGVNVDFK